MKAATLIILLFFLSFSHSLPSFLRHKWLQREKYFRCLSSQDLKLPQDLWFTQSRDHFRVVDTTTWQQRYWVNETFWDRENGPVFLMIGGEGEADPKWVVEGEMMVLAEKYHALAFQLEHRFYGKSQPGADLSMDYITLLNSRQALEDLASFRMNMTTKYNMTDTNRWIAFGGSYPGALAAWLRMKYPSIVYGSVASSAPIQAKFDFYEYFEVVSASLEQARNGPACVATINSAFSLLNKLILDRTKWASLDKMFNLTVGLTTPEDGKMLAMSLAGIFAGIVQYNNDSRSHAVYDMSLLCDVMTNGSIADPIDRLAVLSRSHDLFDNDVSFQDYVKFLSNVTIDPARGDRQWLYQTCDSFGYFQTADSPRQPFGTLFDTTLYTLICNQVFGFTEKDIPVNVNNTNDFYGGLDFNKTAVTNIVFPNGSVDPWHSLSVTANVSESITAVFINGTAHCANMYPANPYDKPQLVAARKEIDAILGTWLAKSIRNSCY